MRDTLQSYRRLLRETARQIALRDDPDRVFRMLRRRIPALLPHLHFELVLRDPDEGTLSFPVVSRRGVLDADVGLRVRPPNGEPPAFLALEDEEVLPVDSIGDPTRAAMLRDQGVTRVLALPLLHRRENLGALCLGVGEDEKLDRPLRRFATELASLLAAVLGRERTERRLEISLRRIEEKADRLRLIHEISTAVNASLDLDEIFRTIVKETRRLIEFDRSVLTVVEKEGERLRRLTVSAEGGGFRTEEAETMRPEGTLSGLVLEQRKPYIVSDIGESGPRNEMEERLYSMGILSYVALPLVVRKKATGTFNLGSRRAGAFRESQLEILRQVAGHLASAVEHARLYRDARDRMRQMTALYEVANTLLSVVDLGPLLEEVLRIVHDTFAFENCAVLLPTETGDELYIRAARGYREETIREFRARIGEEGITGWAAHSGRTVYVPDVRREPRYVRGIEEGGGGSELAIPLRSGDEVIGVLDIESPEVDAFTEREIDALSLFAAQVALAIDRARLFQKVQDQAMTDGLTGLLNQRYFHHRLSREVTRSQRTGRPFSLVLLDMDNLKEINDTCGHLAGNLAIGRVSEILREECREMDSAARYGGDEFALILPETGIEEGYQAAERLRKRIADTRVEGVGAVSVSCGVASFPTSTDNETMLVVLADRAMYQAKRLGRNRSFAAPLPGQAQ